MCSTERTPPLSDEGSREVEEEMRRPPDDTAERQATLERAREWAEIRRRRAESDASRERGKSPVFGWILNGRAVTARPFHFYPVLACGRGAAPFAGHGRGGITGGHQHGRAGRWRWICGAGRRS